MIGCGQLAIPEHGVDQDIGVEDVIAHRREHLIGRIHESNGILRLLEELGNASRIFRVEFDDAELVGKRDRLADGGDGDTGTRRDVCLDHLAEVHAIDVVGTDHDDDVGFLVAQQVETLQDGIR